MEEPPPAAGCGGRHVAQTTCGVPVQQERHACEAGYGRLPLQPRQLLPRALLLRLVWLHHARALAWPSAVSQPLHSRGAATKAGLQLRCGGPHVQKYAPLLYQPCRPMQEAEATWIEGEAGFSSGARLHRMLTPHQAAGSAHGRVFLASWRAVAATTVKTVVKVVVAPRKSRLPSTRACTAGTGGRKR